MTSKKLPTESKPITTSEAALLKAARRQLADHSCKCDECRTARSFIHDILKESDR